MKIFEVKIENDILAHFDDLETAKSYLTTYLREYDLYHTAYEVLKYEIVEHVIIDKTEVVVRDYHEVGGK